MGKMASVHDTETVITGMHPALAITLAELWLSGGDAKTALNLDVDCEIRTGCLGRKSLEEQNPTQKDQEEANDDSTSD